MIKSLFRFLFPFFQSNQESDEHAESQSTDMTEDMEKETGTYVQAVPEVRFYVPEMLTKSVISTQEMYYVE